MKRVLFILVAGGLYLLLTSKSCGSLEEREADRAVQSRDSIMMAVSSADVTPGMLRSYEESARIRLADLAGYAVIAYDTSLDASFRQQAARLMRGLCLPACIPGHAFGPAEVDSVSIARPLQRDTGTSYAGNLTFSGQNIQIHLVNLPVIIGDDTIRTWRLLFGQITPMERPQP